MYCKNSLPNDTFVEDGLLLDSGTVLLAHLAAAECGARETQRRRLAGAEDQDQPLG